MDVSSYLFVRVDSSVEREVHVGKIFDKTVHVVMPQRRDASVLRRAEAAQDGLASVYDEVLDACTAMYL